MYEYDIRIENVKQQIKQNDQILGNIIQDIENITVEFQNIVKEVSQIKVEVQSHSDVQEKNDRSTKQSEALSNTQKSINVKNKE